MSSNELQALFSNLRSRSQERGSASPGTTSFTQQTSRPSSSAFFHTGRMPSTPPPPFSATIAEEETDRNKNMNQARSTSGATAQNLLNLLNFGGSQPALHTSSQQAFTSNTTTASSQNANAPISASDLVAKFMSPTAHISKLEPAEKNLSATQPESSATRNSLLQLLNKQASETLTSGTVNGQDAEEEVGEADQPIQSIETVSLEAAPSSAFIERHVSPIRVFGTEAGREHTPFEGPKSTSPISLEQKPIFTYTNPFEALNASRNQSVTAQSPVPQPTTPATFSFQPTVGMSSPNSISARKKLTPKLRSQRSTTSAPRDESPTVVPTNSQQPGIDFNPSGTNNIQPSVETPVAAEVHEPKEEDTAYVENVQDKGSVSEHVHEENIQDIQDGSGDWEDAEESPDKEQSPRQVPVYNFPIRAFVSITLQLGASSDVNIREDGVMEISRLKKDFDQIDRSLAAATSKYITYAFPKSGGMRIIRQDDGSDRHIFKNSHDRVFNVAFCTTAIHTTLSENQAVLGTGVSGSVYYASVSKEGNDLFEKNQLESESLIFPPFPQADENTAGGVLKTRAKRSSRHPEYFAIGRGKSIQIVWPATALTSRYGINNTNRMVDVEKFYADRPLQILTGKTGKDFTFSEDDSLIVSLDKTGRLRFWDIRNLVDEANATSARVSAVVVDTPILSLSTASPAEKSWPTSVTFVDKARPYKKGGALRYVLVGLRQNHTLQLWDIALGKAVQELNFPHESETDGICSVNYHPESGIIVVSHPTRNSIFFIHLSAPRYTLSSQLSQAVYVQRIAAKDSELPKPESTACMSGIREISFAEKGQLRSVELLPIQKPADAGKDETASLFELYVAHSKGFTCLAINKEDLGWNTENKVLHPIDAQQEGLVILKELKLGSVIEEPARSKSPVKEMATQSKPSKKKSKKSSQPAEETTNGVDEVPQPLENENLSVPVSTDTRQLESVVLDTPSMKEPKKSKKKVDKIVQPAESLPDRSEADRPVSPVNDFAPQQFDGEIELPMSYQRPSQSQKVEVVAARVQEEWFSKEIKRIEATVSDEFKKELEILYQNIQRDRSTQDSSSASRQEAVLRLVSSSLSTNVEKSLSRIVAQQMQQTVVPAVVQHTSTQLADTLSSTLHQMLPNVVATQSSTAISAALQNPNVSRSIAESVGQKLSKHLETQITDLVIKSISPVVKDVAISAAEKASSDTEARLSEQLQQLQLDRAADNEKLDRLNKVLQGMASTLQAMSDSQVAFQGQILKDRQVSSLMGGSSAVSTSRQVSTARGTPDSALLVKPKPMRIRSKADIELEEITNMMNEGRYEEGSIKWLQSTQPVKLFDDLFVRFTPEYLATDVSPLVAFSVAVTVASFLNTNTERRLEWISAAFDAVDLHDPEIADLSQHAPALITSLVQKLESLYMTLAERNPSDPILRVIPSLAKKGRDMKTAFIARSAGSIGSSLPQLSGTGF